MKILVVKSDYDDQYYDASTPEAHRAAALEILKLREFILNDLPEFKALLERMRQYDIDNDQPDCELEEKKQRVLDLAEELGIEIDFL